MGCFELTTVGCGQPSAMCGDVRTIFEDCSRVELHDRTPVTLGCNTWDCVLCHYKKAARESYKAAARLNGLWTEAYKYGVDLHWPVHIITSPPPDEYHRFKTPDSYAKINAQNVKLLKNIGVIGGCTATHRIRGSAKSIRDHKAHKITLADSWHYHTVGYMPEGHKIDSDAFYEATGWIYKTIPLRARAGARNVIAYEVSHAASYRPGGSGSGHLLRWWGVTSYNQLRILETETKTVKLCKVCTADKHRYFEDYQNDRGEAYDIKTERSVQLTPGQLAKVAALVNQPLRPRPTTIEAYTVTEKPITPDGT